MKQTITPQFVEFIPDQIQEGILYISEKYSTVVHKCCCGCGEEVVTPLTPVDWKMYKEGNTVTLSPSIGNWNYRCQSHYWIRKNRIEWAKGMTKQQILKVQEKDRKDKEFYIAETNARKIANQQPVKITNKLSLYNLWIAIKQWWTRH